MKNKLVALFTGSVFVFMIGIIASCDDEIKAEINTTYYESHGIIKDASTLLAIPNIEVSMNGDTVYSNENGEYELLTFKSNSKHILDISFKDINNIFLQKDTTLDFTSVSFTAPEGQSSIPRKSLEVDMKLVRNSI